MISRTARGRAARARIAAVAAGTALAADVWLTPGVALAAADEPPPLVVASCETTASGQPGVRVELRPAAVDDMIVDVLKPLDPLRVLVPEFRDAWKRQQPILVGAILDSRSVIVGPVIADAVVDRLGGIAVLDPVLDDVTDAVWSAIGAACGIGTKPERPAEPERPGEQDSQDDQPDSETGERDQGGQKPASGTTASSPRSESASADASAADAPGLTPDEPLLGGDLLLTDGLPPDGIAFDYRPETTVPIPEFGILDTNGTETGGAMNTGSAVALPADDGAMTRPALLAVALLSLVSAQLARRWLMRRVAQAENHP